MLNFAIAADLKVSSGCSITPEERLLNKDDEHFAGFINHLLQNLR